MIRPGPDRVNFTLQMEFTELATRDVLYKKSVFKIFAKFTGKLLFRSLFLIKLQAEACNFIKKETPT